MKLYNVLTAACLAGAMGLAHATPAPVLSTTPLIDTTPVGSLFTAALSLSAATNTTFRATVTGGGVITAFNLYSYGAPTVPVTFVSESISPNGKTHTLTFGNLLAGDYTLSLTSFSGGTVKVYATSNVGLDLTPTAVPEPESLALALAGVGVAGTLLRRRKSA